MRTKGVLVCGLITGVLFLVFDMFVALLTNPIFSPYSELPIWKSPPDITAGIVFDLINGLILVAVYAMIYKVIPGPGSRKGLNYGIIVTTSPSKPFKNCSKEL